MSERDVDVSRRKFFKGVIATATAATLPGATTVGCASHSTASGQPSAGAPESFDFTGRSSALRPDAVVDSACQFCNSLCRLKVQ